MFKSTKLLNFLSGRGVPMSDLHHQFGKFNLVIPPDHKIKEIHAVDLLYDRNHGPMIKSITSKYTNGVIFDVGANIGDTAAMFRSECENKIICVEGGPTFVNYLEKNISIMGKNIEVVPKFLLTEDLSKRNLQYQDGNGTGTLMAAAENSAQQSDNQISVSELMRLYCKKNEQPCLVKTDTDGFDGYIIKEFLRYIDTIFFFECDPVASFENFDWIQLFEYFEDKKYRLIIFDNFGLPLMFLNSNYVSIMKNLFDYVALQRKLKRISIYYYDVWAIPESDLDIFMKAKLLY